MLTSAACEQGLALVAGLGVELAGLQPDRVARVWRWRAPGRGPASLPGALARSCSEAFEAGDRRRDAGVAGLGDAGLDPRQHGRLLVEEGLLAVLTGGLGRRAAGRSSGRRRRPRPRCPLLRSATTAPGCSARRRSRRPPGGVRSRRCRRCDVVLATSSGPAGSAAPLSAVLNEEKVPVTTGSGPGGGCGRRSDAATPCRRRVGPRLLAQADSSVARGEHPAEIRSVGLGDLAISSVSAAKASRCSARMCVQGSADRATRVRQARRWVETHRGGGLVGGDGAQDLGPADRRRAPLDVAGGVRQPAGAARWPSRAARPRAGRAASRGARAPATGSATASPCSAPPRHVDLCGPPSTIGRQRTC